MLILLANGASRRPIDPPLTNGAIIGQWEAPINQWEILAYRRDHIKLHLFDFIQYTYTTIIFAWRINKITFKLLLCLYLPLILLICPAIVFSAALSNILMLMLQMQGLLKQGFLHLHQLL